jgi:hypothetical protein
VTVLPLRTQGPNGSHGHWAALSRRRKRERHAAFALCPPAPLPCVVRLTRLSAGTLDDDNLRGALKGVRDGCADRLGVADNDSRIRFEYAQDRAPRGSYGVRVEVFPMNDEVM